ncbi:MAG: nickel ABC transporter, nickel/metallophore periplasmic binding protein [Desulfobacterales bacterium]|nr:nickel ABC transporter, nickel/metallophore periplasmic binding protein [Desulfobacterales bacterium]
MSENKCITKSVLLRNAFTIILALLIFTSVSSAEEKVLRYSWDKDVGPLNPHLYHQNQMFAQAMVYESLLRYGENGKIMPWLAERWKISPDGREYTFFLRKGVKFSDGSAFNAMAVKKNYDSVMLNSKRHSWLGVIAQYKDTKVVDDYTFKLVLKKPFYAVLQELTTIRPVRFLAPSAFPNSGNTADGIKKPVGTGPWVLSEYSFEEYAIFKRNKSYWGEKPKIDKIIIKIIPDSEDRIRAFESGEIDLIYGSGQIRLDVFKRLKESGKYNWGISKPITTRSFGFNTKRSPVNELNVRKAIQHAVNKDEITKEILNATEHKADALFAKNLSYANINLSPYAFNPQKAVALLEKAGWKLSPGTEYRSKNGRPLEFDIYFLDTDAVQKAIVTSIKKDLKKVGINAKPAGEEKDFFHANLKAGEFDVIFEETWGAQYDPHSILGAMLNTGGSFFYAKEGLPMKMDINKKIGDVLSSVDLNKRQALYDRILRTLHEQAGFLPISYKANLGIYHKNVTGVRFLTINYVIPFEYMDLR